MRKMLLLTGAAIILGAASFSATETHAKAQCILGTPDGTVSQSGPCNGNNGKGNGSEPSCHLVGNTTVCDGPDTPPGNSGPKGPGR
jgi:hypothetical protein